MMNTLGTNRTARVLLEDGGLSEAIHLDRGRPQGDSPSPRQYNIGQQICLLKIDYDPRIQRLEEQLPTLRPLESFFQRSEVPEEVLQGIDTTNCFADDTNAKLLQKAYSLGVIKGILTEFERISGLKCNIDKTCVMFIGPLDPVEAPQIEEMGFRIVNKIKILGFSVSREGIVEDDNFASTTNNIRKLIAQWT